MSAEFNLPYPETFLISFQRARWGQPQTGPVPLKIIRQDLGILDKLGYFLPLAAIGVDGMTLKIFVKPAEGPEFEYLVETDSLVIGRSRNADLTLQDNYLSRTHARLCRKNGIWKVEDLGSQNGTLLNGRRIGEATPLNNGDVLTLSDSRIVIAGLEVTVPRPRTMDSIFVAATQLLDEQQQEGHATTSQTNRYINRLKVLNDIHRDLAGADKVDRLCELILDKVFQHLEPEEGTIYLRTREGDLYPAAKRSPSSERDRQFHSRNLLEEVAGRGMAALVHDVAEDIRFAEAHSIISSGVRSLVAAPFLGEPQTRGMIVLSSRAARRQFSEEDMALLVSLASIASLGLGNLALIEEAAQRRRLEAELALARRIQVALLPETLPQPQDYQLYADNQPSLGVSGDFFQIIERPVEQELVFVVADVSGKGMSASLLTASLEALAAGPIEDGLPPAVICARLSRMLYRRTPPDRYATMFLGVLQVKTGLFTYANAGHNPPFLIAADGSCQLLKRTGTPVGLLPENQFTEESCIIEVGGLLVIYTDGITEAANPAFDMYGPDRLSQLLSLQRQQPLVILAAMIQDDLESFVQGEPFNDDRTLVMVRRICQDQAAEPEDEPLP